MKTFIGRIKPNIGEENLAVFICFFGRNVIYYEKKESEEKI